MVNLLTMPLGRRSFTGLMISVKSALYFCDPVSIKVHGHEQTNLIRVNFAIAIREGWGHWRGLKNVLAA